jgi:hypothetical protein
MERPHRAPMLVRCALVLSLAVSAAPAQRTTQPARAAIPTPESVLGFPVGAEGKLIDYDQSIGYFKRLAAASNRIRLITVGKTSYGKSWTAAIISSPENLAGLDRYRQINMRIAHPSGLTDAEARALARQGKVIVDISGGLHASEIAGSQHTPQLAYELLSKATEPGTKEIFDNVIFFLWPSINPDGQDIVVASCRGTGPNILYQKYIGHDNNRDSYMLNVIESRVIARTWREWEPDIIYVHHQSSPFPTRIWIPPFADPIGLRAPPIMGRTVNAIGTRIAAELDAKGQPGAVHALATFDAYYPGYIDYMPMYQNIPAWWTETQGGGCSPPATDRPVTNPRDSIPQALYVSPWVGGKWGLRDAVDYMVTASTATLNYAAKFKEEILYNRYQAGRNTIKQFATSAPYAYVIPQAQHDAMAPVELLRRMAFLGVRVSQATRDFTYDGVTYSKGTWVIPMDQEFAQLVRELFEVQKYPAVGDDTPYDAAGWTLPFQMNVTVAEGGTPLPADVRSALQPVSGKAEPWGASPEYPFTTNAMAAGIVPQPGAITGSGDQLILDPAQNNSFRLINRALAAGAQVHFAPASGGRGARYVVTGADAVRADGWAKELFVTGERVAGGTTAVQAPVRIGLYKASANNMDQGWTEWLFDTHEFKYTLVSPADLQAGNLGSRFDVIVFGSQGIGAGGGGRGGGGGGGGRGRGGATPDSAARPEASVQNVDDFVRGGGTVVAWSGGTNALITALRLPVRNVVASVPRNQYFTGISIMQVMTDPVHPVMAGMPERADVTLSGSTVFTTLDGFDGAVIAKYRADASPLRSGFLNGEQFIKGFAAAIDVKRDRGHVILFSFQPQWRGQPTGTFRAVFNSVFFARELAAQARATPGFWTPPAVPGVGSSPSGTW